MTTFNKNGRLAPSVGRTRLDHIHWLIFTAFILSSGQLDDFTWVDYLTLKPRRRKIHKNKTQDFHNHFQIISRLYCICPFWLSFFVVQSILHSSFNLLVEQIWSNVFIFILGLKHIALTTILWCSIFLQRSYLSWGMSERRWAVSDLRGWSFVHMCVMWPQRFMFDGERVSAWKGAEEWQVVSALPEDRISAGLGMLWCCCRHKTKSITYG